MANESTTLKSFPNSRARRFRGHLDAGTGGTLTPFGRSCRPALFGYSGDNKSFVESGVVGKIDLSESVQAALQWMEYEVPAR